MRAAVFLVLAFVCLFLAARLVFGAPSDVWTEVDQTKSAGGAKVTLERAYAAERFVAVDLRTQPGRFAPALYDDTVGNEAEFEPYVQITDASGQDFDSVGGGIWLPPRGTGAEAVFDAPEGLESTGREHRFRLEVPLSTQQKLVAKPGPFVFEFEVPVAEAPTTAVDQQVEAEGIVMTLERVVNSPVLPQAIVCFESPDAKRFWMPWLQHDPIYSDPVALGNALGRMALGKREVWSNPYRLGDGCWSLQMDAPVAGRSSVTVTHLDGTYRATEPKIIRGPWTFEFEVPRTS